jgi:PAS domain S-box-containing protein
MRNEEALRVSESSYRAIFEASEDAIFIHDWDTGAIVDVNPKACAAYGYTPEEMKRLTVSDISSNVPPYTAEEAAGLMERARRGEPVHFEWHRRNRDGSLHWDDVVLKQAVIAGKRRIVAFTREITERKLAEQALRASEEQYRQIFNASMDGMVLRDADYRVVDANPAALAMSGYAREEVLGTDRALLQAADRALSIRSRLRDVLAGERVRFEGEAIGKDGRRIEIEFRGMPVQYRGRPHVLTIAHDLTERRRAEAERVQLEAQLRQAQKMEAIGHLTGGIAHDFNNLLTTILGYVVLADERGSEAGDARLGRYLEQARLACERARDLIQQMLTFSRGQRGEPRPLSLPPLVKESVKLFRSSLPSTIEIETDLEQEVPAVMLDPVHVDQMLLNLCLNARDAMNAVGTIRLVVRAVSGNQGTCTACRNAVEGDRVELSIEDDGPGIAPGILDRIFEPFFTTKEAGKGSGMGLAMVHGIVHEHGGHVVVDTAPAEGARFRVLFEALPQAAGTPETAAKGASGGARSSRAPLRGHVLVVDDETSVAGFMRDLLETWGLEVTVAHDGAQARELIGRAPAEYDLVVTDQLMPRVTGVQLARELLILNPRLPILLYTGFSDDLSEVEIKRAGIRALLKKPVDADALYRLLAAHLPATERVR